MSPWKYRQGPSVSICRSLGFQLRGSSTPFCLSLKGWRVGYFLAGRLACVLAAHRLASFISSRRVGQCPSGI